MKRLGIYGLPKRRLPRGAKVGKASSLDLVRRRFTAEGPDRLWMTDITEHPNQGGQDLLLRGNRRVLTRSAWR
jgi:putative transposase